MSRRRRGGSLLPLWQAPSSRLTARRVARRPSQSLGTGTTTSVISSTCHRLGPRPRPPPAPLGPSAAPARPAAPRGQAWGAGPPKAASAARACARSGGGRGVCQPSAFARSARAARDRSASSRVTGASYPPGRGKPPPGAANASRARRGPSAAPRSVFAAGSASLPTIRLRPSTRGAGRGTLRVPRGGSWSERSRARRLGATTGRASSARGEASFRSPLGMLSARTRRPSVLGQARAGKTCRPNASMNGPCSWPTWWRFTSSKPSAAASSIQATC